MIARCSRVSGLSTKGEGGARGMGVIGEKDIKLSSSKWETSGDKKGVMVDDEENDDKGVVGVDIVLFLIYFNVIKIYYT
ncbi:MAG: hypothetical protein V4487_00945 [Chlamydiota bacterium]